MTGASFEKVSQHKAAYQSLSANDWSGALRFQSAAPAKCLLRALMPKPGFVRCSPRSTLRQPPLRERFTLKGFPEFIF